jgi:dTMP kinase
MAGGAFITLEGPEGGGKTTQAAMLLEALRQRGYDALLCAEPGGGRIPQAIRALLLDPASAGMTSRAELLLFLAARAQHVEETIRPALDAGRVVVCDRFSDSTMAYQGHAAGLDLERVAALNEFAAGGLRPDLTLLLDIDPEAGLARQREWNRMEAKGLEYHRRVREGFLAQARRHPERIHVLDATRPIDAVHADIMRIVTTCLNHFNETGRRGDP